MTAPDAHDHAPAPGALGPLVAFLVFGGFWGAWVALVPGVQRATGASDSQLGLALLAGGIGALPSMLAVGPVARRFGVRAIALTVTCFAAVAVLPALAPGPMALTAAMFLVGAASGATDVCMNHGAVLVESGGRRMMQLAHALFSVGFLFGAAGAGLALRADAGTTGILAASAVLLAATALLNLDGRRGDVDGDVMATEPGSALEPATGPAPRKRRLALTRPLLLLGTLGACGFIVEGSIESWSSLHLQRTLDASPAAGAIAPSAMGIAMIVGRLGHQVVGARMRASSLYVFGGLLSMVGVLVVAAAPSVPVAVAGCALVGISVAGLAPATYSLAGRLGVGVPAAIAMSTVTTVAYLGSLLGPTVTGFVSDAAGLRVGIAWLVVPALAITVGGWLGARRAP